MKAAELHNLASQVKQGRKINMMIYSTAWTTGSEIMTLCLITVFQLLLAVSGSISPVLHYVTWYYFHYVQPYNHNELNAQRLSIQMTVSPSGRPFCLYLPLIVPVKHRYVAKSSVREKFPDISNSLLSPHTVLSPYASNVAFHIHSSASVQSMSSFREAIIVPCILIALEK